jgi:hypothetical protein
MALAPHLQMVV